MLPSKHFKRSEFRCKCGCGFDTVDAELLMVLDTLRFQFDAPVTILSGCRCNNYNSKVGGATFSQHPKGRAADVVVKGVSPDDVGAYLTKQYPDQYGIGKYDTFTHIDTRNDRARWGA